MTNRTPPSNLVFSITVVMLLLVVFYFLSVPYRVVSFFHPIFSMGSAIVLSIIGSVGAIAIIRRFTYTLNPKRFLYVFPAIANIGFGLTIFLISVYEQITGLNPMIPITCIAIGAFALTDVLVERKPSKLTQYQ